MKKWHLFFLFFLIIFGLSTQTKASNDVILASVDWVVSKISPIEEKVLEQEKTIQELISFIDLPNYVYSKENNVSIYTNTSLTSSILGTKNKGNALQVLSVQETSTGYWFRVVFDSNNNGWLHINHMTYKPVPEFTQISIKQNTPLYKWADSSADTLISLNKGEVVTYFSTFENQKGEIWYDVRISSGIRGWMNALDGQVK